MKSKKKLLIGCSVLLLLGAILTAVWVGCDWPPPRLILKYGFPPAGGPTGRRLTIHGLSFTEIAPGYGKVGSTWGQQSHGSMTIAVHRLRALLGMEREPFGWRAGSRHQPFWMEQRTSFWFQESMLPEEYFARCREELGEALVSCRGADLIVHPALFSTWLSGRSGSQLRLPSTEEWEYTAWSGLWRSVTEHTQYNSQVPPAQWTGVVWNARWISPVILAEAAQWASFTPGCSELTGQAPYEYNVKARELPRFRLVLVLPQATPHK